MLNSTLVGRFNVSVGATPPTVALVPMADVTMPVARVFFQIAFSDSDPNDRVNTANIGTGCVGWPMTGADTHAGKISVHVSLTSPNGESVPVVYSSKTPASGNAERIVVTYYFDSLGAAGGLACVPIAVVV